MITWLIGENSFEIREALRRIEKNFDGQAERVDASALTLAQLPDLLMGMSLFNTNRLVVLDGISTNSVLWEKMPDWLPRVSESIHLVYIDTKPDKRTVSYKALKAVADVQEFPVWSERDTAKAEQWLANRAKQQSIPLSQPAIRHIVQRVGVDQWLLANALDVVALLEEVTPDTIDATIPKTLNENVFQLFETALGGDSTSLSRQIRALQLQEDPYALFALLSSQVMTLAALVYAGSGDNPTKDFAIHPFVASKMQKQAQRLGKARVGSIVEAFAQTDADLKRSKAAPWVLVERALLKVATG